MRAHTKKNIYNVAILRPLCWIAKRENFSFVACKFVLYHIEGRPPKAIATTAASYGQTERQVIAS